MSKAVLRSEIIGDLAQFDALTPHWWKLWQQSPSATPFQSPAWLVPWWHAFAPGELATVAVWRGGDLVGLAPLYLEHGTAGSKLLPVGISLSDYLDILAVPGIEAEVVAIVAESILSIGWVQWILSDLPQDSVALAMTHPEMDWPTAHAACPVLALAGDETLAGCVPARRRRQLRRARQAASRCGRIAMSSASGSPQTFLDQLIRLHNMRWAEQGGGVLANAAVEQFHRLSLPVLDAHGLVRCWLFAIDGGTVGAYYGFHHCGRAYAYLGGFDPAYAEESPGAILIGHAIAEAIREDAREFDFLRGQEAYKYGWGAVDRWTMRRVWTRS
ncbi:GNAT family N-acetyltransferase [Mesorhizobium sp. M7A.F.Ca.US.010.02.1.1]|uniref:GNAT family N-acetyltransferase n=1 Tax=unclassified Mesorhizobium TaxID=325217 RepID=UPI000FD19C84|nr:GNAT family N-acetyltransferase [Mesorhizobium sp. M7A.F.Ca.US.010.02.1.1]RUW91882.1 GNAT family N-acetyltransferase [Mesorhizobium sp. M7A.F.Ca.US.010.02.1.1]